MSDELAPAKRLVLERLQRRTLERRSLGGMIRARHQRSLLLLDCSGTMGDEIGNPTHTCAGCQAPMGPIDTTCAKCGRELDRKIDVMRRVVGELQATNEMPVIGFGLKDEDGQVGLIEEIPEPHGGTPIAHAITFASECGANHILLVSDGLPDCATSAREAAMAFRGRIDTFYIGQSPNDSGAVFMKDLAELKGGTYDYADLSRPRELTSKIRGLLTAGGAA